MYVCNIFTSNKNCYFRFNRLTDRFFKNNPWPDADVVAPIVQDGKLEQSKI